MRDGGPAALDVLRANGLRPSARDYGPRLHWECDIWTWFQRLSSGHPARVDGWRWLQLATRESWHEDTAFTLLAVVEQAVVPPELLKAAENAR